jgi:uncharacterized protein YdeI (YjbR/CyaY-like superfamily)
LEELTTMEFGETFSTTSREEWRQWLAEHHGLKAEIWLVFYKKGSGKPSLPYEEAVEEAVCYGWIDSLVKSIDEERYARRFSPRRPGGEWSAYNMRRALKMLRAGKMAPAGEALLPPEVLEAWGEGE